MPMIGPRAHVPGGGPDWLTKWWVQLLIVVIGIGLVVFALTAGLMGWK